MNKVSLILFVLFAASMSSCKTDSKSTRMSQFEKLATPYEDMTVSEARNFTSANPDAIFLDVRTPQETSAGVIEGAKIINVNGGNFEAEIGALDKTKTYVVYCKAGGRSVKACKIMQEKGFENLYNIKGGYTAWQSSK